MSETRTLFDFLYDLTETQSKEISALTCKNKELEDEMVMKNRIIDNMAKLDSKRVRDIKMLRKNRSAMEQQADADEIARLKKMLSERDAELARQKAIIDSLLDRM